MDNKLRDALLDLKKPDKFTSKQPIEAELQDLLDLYATYSKLERIKELERFNYENFTGQSDFDHKAYDWVVVNVKDRINQLKLQGGTDDKQALNKMRSEYDEIF